VLLRELINGPRHGLAVLLQLPLDSLHGAQRFFGEGSTTAFRFKALDSLALDCNKFDTARHMLLCQPEVSLGETSEDRHFCDVRCSLTLSAELPTTATAFSTLACETLTHLSHT